MTEAKQKIRKQPLAIALVPQELIESKILLINGKKVMLDADLALLYQVKTKGLNQAVRRNKRRFPDDFMFQLTKEQKEYVVTNCDHLKHLKFSPTNPLAFTEQGVAMLSSVLNSERAIEVNIQIMRTFTKIREFLISNAELRAKIELLEKKFDNKFKIVFDAIKSITEAKKEDFKPPKPIGFKC
jgi:hypothetical protein